jgi:hypothetical protein
MKNNYFYNLPQDLQEKIYYIDIINNKNIINEEVKSIYNSIKYINKIVDDSESALYNFMDDENISCLVNEIAIEHNISLLKDEIIYELHVNLQIKKNITMFYLQLSEYLDDKFSDDEYDEYDYNGSNITIENISIYWNDSMESLLLENYSDK